MAHKINKTRDTHERRPAKSKREAAGCPIVGNAEEDIASESKAMFSLREMISRIPRGYKVEEHWSGDVVGKEEW